MSLSKQVAAAFAVFLLLGSPADASSIGEVVDAIDAKIEQTVDELNDLWAGYKNLTSDEASQLAIDSAALQAFYVQLVAAKDTVQNDPNADINSLIVALHLDVSPI